MDRKKHKTLRVTRKNPKVTPSLVDKLFEKLWTKRTKYGKVIVVIVSIFVLIVSSMYSVAYWYQFRHKDIPLTIGATFVPNYARYFDLEPKEVMRAMIDDLGIRRLRLVSYWKDIERNPGEFDFSELDWQFDMAEAANVEVSLAIGLRQPRWPECHGPQWAMEKPMEQWSVDLNNFMSKVIERYGDNPALVEYQLENEYFLSVFGECPDFTRQRLIDEFNYVKSLDSDTPVVISRSNNALGLPVGQPRPDKFAVSVYKRVWDKTLTKRYYEYPFPAWFYSSLAGGGELVTGKQLFIHELQTEAWLPGGMSMKTAPIDELYKSLNPDRLRNRIQYGVDTGMRVMDVWGVEWWYHMKTKRDSPEIWDAAREEFAKHRDKTR